MESNEESDTEELASSKTEITSPRLVELAAKKSYNILPSELKEEIAKHSITTLWLVVVKDLIELEGNYFRDGCKARADVLCHGVYTSESLAKENFPEKLSCREFWISYDRIYIPTPSYPLTEIYVWNTVYSTDKNEFARMMKREEDDIELYNYRFIIDNKYGTPLYNVSMGIGDYPEHIRNFNDHLNEIVWDFGDDSVEVAIVALKYKKDNPSVKTGFFHWFEKGINCHRGLHISVGLTEEELYRLVNTKQDYIVWYTREKFLLAQKEWRERNNRK